MLQTGKSLSTFAEIIFVANLKKIEVEAGEQTPSVLLDKEKGIFKIEGFSFSDNPHIFYAPVVDWFKEYCNSPNEETQVVFNFVYVNSTSVKFINDILKLLDGLFVKGKTAGVTWHMNPDDEDIEQLGLELKGLHAVPFKIEPKDPGRPEPPKKKFLG
jgi:hypothetical protein